MGPVVLVKLKNKRVRPVKKKALVFCYKLIVSAAFFGGSFFVWDGAMLPPPGFCNERSAKDSNLENSVAVEEAFEKLKSGDYSEAQKSFQEILELDPNNQTVCIGLGVSLLYQKKYDDAVEVYKKAIALDSANPVSYMNMGDVFSAQKKWKEARGWYEKANSLGLKHSRFFNNLGMSCFMSGDSESAVIFFRKALEMKKESKTYQNLGMAYGTLKNFSAAQEAFLEALKIDPSDSYSLSNLGFAQFMTGNPQKGIRTIEMVLKRSPQDSLAHNNLGVIYLALKNYDAALSHLSEAGKGMPNDADVYNNTGLAYWGKKDKANAKVMFKKALSLDPDNKNYKHQLELSA